MRQKYPDRLQKKNALRGSTLLAVWDSIAGARIRSSRAYLASALWILLCAGELVAEAPCKEDPRGCPQAASEETARGLALGSGVRASAISTSALAYNTAGLPLGKLYHLEGIFDLQPSKDTIGLGAAVVDSSTSSLAAGLSIRGLIENGREGVNGIDAYLGLGLPLADILSIGVGGRYINLWTPHGYDGDERNERYDSEGYFLTKGFTLDTAVRINPVEILHVAALAYNVVNRHSAYVPVMAGGSVAFNIGRSFIVGVDSLADLSTFKRAQLLIGGGGEYLSGPGVPLRLGYRYDNGRRIHLVAGGIGYTSQSFGLDLSLQQEVSGGHDTRITAAVRIYVL
jgi:hypothetical protein